MFLQLGVRRENLIMTDLDGVIYEGRTAGMNPYKQAFARKTSLRGLQEALDGADVVVGLSAKGALSGEMIRKMASDPIVFAMANPDPEVLPEEVFAVREDAIMATGRSDYPNQVNNVLGFPFIFRGALDSRATTINEEMKLAAVRAIAQLAKQEVPENVVRAYGGQRFRFGREYLIPKPFDQRALLWVAPAVAEAAMRSGVARKNDAKMAETRRWRVPWSFQNQMNKFKTAMSLSHKHCARFPPGRGRAGRQNHIRRGGRATSFVPRWPAPVFW